MPLRKYASRFKKSLRRRFRRSKKTARKGVIVNSRALQPFPARYITKLKYSQTYKPVNSTGTNIWQLRLNSIFDPDLTGVGGQPYGRDTFDTLYTRYRVINCKYIVNAWSSDGHAIQVLAIPSNETLTYAGALSELRMHPRAKYMIQAGSGSELKTLKGNCYIPALVGRSKTQYMADDRYQSTMGTNPAENAFLSIYAQLLDESLLVNPSVVFTVTMVYTVEFFDAKNLAAS